MRLSFNSFRQFQNTIMLFMALLIGLLTSGIVYIFRHGIEWFHYFFTEVLGSEGYIGAVLENFGINPAWALIITLSLAGFIVGLIMHYIVGPEKYHGAATIIESVALAGGRLRYHTMPFKILASAMSLGAGASVGPEDPSVQIGANLASFFGDKLHFSDDNRRLLVASGAASAIAAAFSAPIAGVFFALEIVLREFTAKSFGSVVLAAVISSAFSRSLLGSNPVFGELDYTLGSPIQLPFYALLGIILAFVSAFAIRFFHWQTDFWHHRVRLWLPLETAITGAFVGLVGIYLPEILGPGEHFMHKVLTGHFEGTIVFLLLLAVVKLVMTAISQGGGFVGGVFAPTLFIGITIGSAYGQILNRLFPAIEMGNPQAYAIAGMAGLLAGIVRAPITAILLVFELTTDYDLILPIMLTSVICTLIVEQTGPAGIYILELLKKGVHLSHERDVDVMQGIIVEKVMLKPAPGIKATASIQELQDAFNQHHSRALCVFDDDDKLIGIVTPGDLQDALEILKSQGANSQNIDSTTVLDICKTDVKTINSDDVLWRAIQLMGEHEIGRLPVLDGKGKVSGLLRRHDIMKAYNSAIELKFRDQHFAEQIRLNTLTGAHVLEYVVTSKSAVMNKAIRDIELPDETVLASIVRDGKLLIPHGETILFEKDKITIVADAQAEPILEGLFK